MAEPEVDPLGPVPVYRQVADVVCWRIAAGTLSENRPMPSETALMQEFGIARGTARRVADVLRDERGLILTVPGRGSYVVAGGQERAREWQRPH